MQFPDQRFSVVILSNLSTFNAGRIARKIADLYLADQFTEPPIPRRRERYPEEKREPIMLSSPRLQEYKGKYYSDELDITYTLEVENDNVILNLRDTTSILTPYSSETFGWGRRNLYFTRDIEKRITGFVLQAEDVKNIRFQKLRK